MNGTAAQSNSPSLEQKELFENVRQRIGISKYIDFIKIIKHVLQEERINRETNKRISKATYDSYVTRLVRVHYPATENVQGCSGNNILEKLKKTNLHSKFLSEHINNYVDEVNTESSYVNISTLNNESTEPTCGGMTAADRAVLNHKYILPNNLMHKVKPNGRQSKESLANRINDKKIEDAEDALHDVEMQLVRNMGLQVKLQYIIDRRSESKRIKSCNLGDYDIPFIINPSSASSHTTYSSEESSYYQGLRQQLVDKKVQVRKRKRNLPVELSETEFATLLDLCGCEIKSSDVNVQNTEERKIFSALLKEKMRTRPARSAKELLPFLKERQQSLKKRKELFDSEYARTMELCLLNSIRRNSEPIKKNEYPFLLLENLLLDVIVPDSGADVPTGCFMKKNDDVSTQLAYEDGLIMQFEAIKWHNDAIILLQSSGNVAQRQRLHRFFRLVKRLFDINIENGRCTRKQEEGSTRIFLYGCEWLYAAIRLYHVLLVRLQSAYLQAEVDTAEWRLRTHCNDVGKKRLQAINPHAYLSEFAKMAAGWNKVSLPPTEGNAEEKIEGFLEAVKKR